MRDIINEVYQTMVERGATGGVGFVKEAERNGYEIDLKTAYNYTYTIKDIINGKKKSMQTDSLCDVLMCLDIRFGYEKRGV